MISRILRRKAVRDYAWRLALKQRISRGPRSQFERDLARVDALIEATRDLRGGRFEVPT